MLEKDLDEVNNINTSKYVESLKDFLNVLYGRATNIPENIAFDFTFPKKILESIKKGFENNCYSVVD